MRKTAAAPRSRFAAIEIEDQLLPKRAHHHIGIARRGQRVSRTRDTYLLLHVRAPSQQRSHQERPPVEVGRVTTTLELVRKRGQRAEGFLVLPITKKTCSYYQCLDILDGFNSVFGPRHLENILCVSRWTR